MHVVRIIMIVCRLLGRFILRSFVATCCSSTSTAITLNPQEQRMRALSAYWASFWRSEHKETMDPSWNTNVWGCRVHSWFMRRLQQPCIERWTFRLEVLQDLAGIIYIAFSMYALSIPPHSGAGSPATNTSAEIQPNRRDGMLMQDSSETWQWLMPV